MIDNTAGRILIVDDNEDILASLRLLLKSHFEEVATLNSPARIPELLGRGNYDLFSLNLALE